MGSLFEGALLMYLSFVIVFVFVFVIVFFFVRSFLLITLIKCLKGHKSLGSLFHCVFKKVCQSVSQWVTRSPIELSAGQLKKFIPMNVTVTETKIWLRIFRSLFRICHFGKGNKCLVIKMDKQVFKYFTSFTKSKSTTSSFVNRKQDNYCCTVVTYFGCNKPAKEF